MRRIISTFFSVLLLFLSAVIESKTNTDINYQELLQLDPATVAKARILELADDAQRNGRLPEVADWLNRAWQMERQSLTLGLILVQYYLEQLDRLAALKIAKDLYSSNPDSDSALRSLGLVLLASDANYAAIELFRELNLRQPDSAEVWYLQALAWMQLGDEQLALAALQQALNLRDDYLPAQVMLSQIYLNNEDYDQALLTAKSIQDQATSLGLGFRLEGDIFMRRNAYAEAVRAYSSAYDKAANAQGALLLADAYWHIDDKEQALSALRAWLAVSPGDGRTRLQLAQYLDRMQRRQEAILEYEQVLDQDSDNVLALNNLAWLYSRRGQYDKALEYAQKAVDLAPEQAEISDTLGWVLVKLGQNETALPLLQKAAQAAPHIPSIQYHLAVVCSKLGQIEKAKQLLQMLVTLHKPFPELQYAEKLLNKLN